MGEGNQKNSLDIEVAIPGLMKPDVVNDNNQSADPIILSITGDSPHFLPNEEAPITKVRDGRVALQSIRSNEPSSEQQQVQLAASTFASKGFCCLPHKTSVKKWNESYIKGMIFGSDISRVYATEVESILRNTILPDYDVIEVDCPPAVLRRGPGSRNNNFYGSGVHQDYGLTFQDYITGVSAYDPSGYAIKSIQEKYDRDEVKGIMVINFWRPIGGYVAESPMLYKPLAVCDPATVKVEDTVHTGYDAQLFGGAKGKKTDQMSLKSNAAHDWYYYPRMTDDEVLVFKQIEVWKNDPKERKEMPVRGCFHTALDDPNTPEGTAPRCSTECRVLVYLGEKSSDMGRDLWTPPASKFSDACAIL